ncbi:MAG: bacillithiol biosynthesis cysteine-adding enzyme BshC [Bacteroidetes bacterium]|nr:bacillithiol biosynthesis cysteine-adding enzyme BshC [Bacteroidota bacterium]
MYLSFSDIPGHQDLFLDYVYNFDKVSQYFSKNFRKVEEFDSHFKAVLNKYQLERSKLYGLISKQYFDVKCSDLTKTNIDLLGSDNTLAIVTGQQLGISGGPMYTIYKIMTAIKLSRHLKENFNEYNFVPVFWLEGDDHDFNEVRSLTVFNQANNLESIEYNDDLPEESNRGSVGVMEFNGTIEKFASDLKETLRPTEFTDNLIETFKNAYFEGANFKDAFFDLLITLFDEQGLIIFDPLNASVKKELIPIFTKELDEYRKNADKLVLRSADLEETHHAQVKIRPINLFILDNKERLAIEPADEGYRLKGKRKILTKNELTNIINERPDKISPNVILRPICQDYLLPTAFYIGGPGEISYFAQVLSIYDNFGIEPPIIYPRSSATIIEKNIKSILDKYEMSYEDAYADAKELNKNIVQKLSDIDVESLFSNTDKEIERLLDQLSEKLSGIDPNLTDLVEKSKQRILQTTENMKSKTENADKRRFETALRQIEKAVTMIYPGSNLQEREINYIYFANKYGPDFLTDLYNNLSINIFKHQFIEI